MRAADLPAAFADVPPAWRQVLPGWTPALEQSVCARVAAASGDRAIAPDDPFRALRAVPPDAVRVVLVGQDPYPRAGDPDGLAFSSRRGVPHSLRRVFAQLAADRPGWQPPAHGGLDRWAARGVLLLNAALTVEVGRAGAHMGCGWQALTSQVVQHLWAIGASPAFLLWGRPAGEFFDAAVAELRVGPPRRGVTAPPVWRTRHPSHDFQRRFMAEGSHFLATADRVDWWGD